MCFFLVAVVVVSLAIAALALLCRLTHTLTLARGKSAALQQQ